MEIFHLRTHQIKSVVHCLNTLATCALICGPAAGRVAADDTILAGEKVTVISWDAKFIADGEVVGEPDLGDTFTVESVEGDLLWIESRNGCLHQFDVVPSEDSVDYFTRRIEDDASIINFFNRGYHCLKHGKLDIAIDDFNVAIRLDRSNSAPYVGRGCAWYQKRKYKNAIVDFSRAIRLEPSEFKAYVHRGLAWCRIGQTDKGIDDFNTAIRLNSTSVYAFCCRAAAWKRKGNFADALLDLGIANWHDPNALEPYKIRAEVFIAKGQYKMALAELEYVIRIDRANGLNAVAWLRATSTEPKLRNGTQALLAATEACELTNWENDSYINTLSAALAELGMFDEAIERLQQAIDMNPDNSKEICDSMMAAFKAKTAYRCEPEM